MSTIEVTNINDISGNASLVTDNGGLKTDKLTGKTTAGSISVVGEGNSTTTNLQQGLAKMWLSMNGTGTVAIDDSLNIASITDNSTGNYTNTFTNAMSAASFASFAGGDINNSNDDVRRNNRLFQTTTALVKVVCGNNTNSNTKEDWTEVFTSAHGDLA